MIFATAAGWLLWKTSRFINWASVLVWLVVSFYQHTFHCWWYWYLIASVPPSFSVVVNDRVRLMHLLRGGHLLLRCVVSAERGFILLLVFNLIVEFGRWLSIYGQHVCSLLHTNSVGSKLLCRSNLSSAFFSYIPHFCLSVFLLSFLPPFFLSFFLSLFLSSFTYLFIYFSRSFPFLSVPFLFFSFLFFSFRFVSFPFISFSFQELKVGPSVWTGELHPFPLSLYKSMVKSMVIMARKFTVYLDR